MTARATTPPRASAPRSEDEVRAFVERLGSALTDAGMSRLPARAFAAMLADEDGRMTSAELAEVLEVSPASVSGAVRYLSQVLFLHREREPGTRRDVYVVREDAWHDAIVNMRRTYAPIQAAIASGVDAVGGPGTQAGERLSGLGRLPRLHRRRDDGDRPAVGRAPQDPVVADLSPDPRDIRQEGAAFQPPKPGVGVSLLSIVPRGAGQPQSPRWRPPVPARTSPVSR